MVERVAGRARPDRLLVNNAAGNFYAPSATLSPNAWRAVVETDLYGTFYCSQAVYPVMKAQGGGRIVSISMTLHYRGWPLMAHATAAKAGVDALTRTLALEWAADRITVNAIAPGPIPTEGVKQAFTPPGRRLPNVPPWTNTPTRAIPLGRWGKPEDVGQMVTFSRARPATGSPARSSWWTVALARRRDGARRPHVSRTLRRRTRAEARRTQAVAGHALPRRPVAPTCSGASSCCSAGSGSASSRLHRR